MNEPASPDPSSVEDMNPLATESHGPGAHAPPTGAVRLRLLASVIALAAGVAALIVAIELLRTVLG